MGKVSSESSEKLENVEEVYGLYLLYMQDFNKEGRVSRQIGLEEFRRRWSGLNDETKRVFARRFRIGFAGLVEEGRRKINETLADRPSA
jgi:hypothetical protein